MNKKMVFAVVVATVLAFSGIAQAAGILNMYNWGNYTNPELIKKFEEKYDIKVTITDYDSNSTALAKVKAGGHGFDMVVPSANYVKIFIEEGSGCLRFARIRWKTSSMSPLNGAIRRGTRAAATVYRGSGARSASSLTQNFIKATSTPLPSFLTRRRSLSARSTCRLKWAMLWRWSLMYVGSKPCSTDKAALKKARDVLMAAKPKWVSFDYGLTEKMPRGDYNAAAYWNGAAFRARLAKPSIRFGYPREGFPVWMDSVVVLKTAKNVENAKLFMNFIMEPENAALISSFARYANGITGSEKFMPEDMKTAVEIIVPDEFKDAGVFVPACSKEANDYYTAIWTELTK